MNPKTAIISALQLICVFAFFLIGLFFFCLPHLSQTRIQISEMLQNSPGQCTSIGLGVIFFSFFIFLIFYTFNQGRYLVIKMGVSTNIKLIQKAVERCFEQQFSKKVSLKEIEIGPNSHLNFKVCFRDSDASEMMYAEIEKQLACLLEKRFGYEKDFNLVIKKK